MDSIFNILGPVMVGPSSSHTAGAVNIGRIARQVFGKTPDTVKITLYGSFAETYKGHGTDRALVAGILGYYPYSPEVKDALLLAEKAGIACCFIREKESNYHPNTVCLQLSKGSESTRIVAASVGGGAVSVKEIDSFHVDLSGTYNTILCWYPEQVGMVASVSSLLANSNVNIAFMKVSRSGRRSNALMVVETDEAISKELLDSIVAVEGVSGVRYVEKIT